MEIQGTALSRSRSDRSIPLSKVSCVRYVFSKPSAEVFPISIVVSNIGESCTETCARTKDEVPTKTYACLDAILPKLLFTGAPRLLRSNFNCKSNLVYDGSVTKYRNVAPAINTNGNGCYTTVGRHLMCKAKMKNVRRLCVCVEKL